MLHRIRRRNESTGCSQQGHMVTLTTRAKYRTSRNRSGHLYSQMRCDKLPRRWTAAIATSIVRADECTANCSFISSGRLTHCLHVVAFASITWSRICQSYATHKGRHQQAWFKSMETTPILPVGSSNWLHLSVTFACSLAFNSDRRCGKGGSAQRDVPRGSWGYGQGRLVHH